MAQRSKFAASLTAPLTTNYAHSLTALLDISLFTFTQPLYAATLPHHVSMLPRLAIALLSLVALVAASPAPIDAKLQPIIASKNNIGFVNPPKPNAAAARMVPGVGAALAVGVVAVFF
ncbi:hypothetical protein C8R46DRAFT_28911 [Mycena filopes]|nr:hypothetical protein C8R46DRAFT_28911 [Mycena filopes]